MTGLIGWMTSTPSEGQPSSELLEKMERAWKAVTDSSDRPSYIVCSNERRCRSVRKWRGRRFVVKQTFIDAYRRAIKGLRP